MKRTPTKAKKKRIGRPPTDRHKSESIRVHCYPEDLEDVAAYRLRVEESLGGVRLSISETVRHALRTVGAIRKGP